MDAINTSELIRRMPWSEAHAAELEMLLAREWLVTNGLGGYAAGTVSGILTRRYHGLLVAALPAPFGRMMLLLHLSEQLRLSDRTIIRLGGEERAGEAFQLYGAQYFSEFRLEYGLPIWRYNVGGGRAGKAGHAPTRTKYSPHHLSPGVRCGNSPLKTPTIVAFPGTRGACEYATADTLHTHGGGGSLRSLSRSRATVAPYDARWSAHSVYGRDQKDSESAVPYRGTPRL